MSIEEKVNNDIKAAMLAKDAKKLDALRAIKSEILLLKSSPGGTSDDAEMKALMKMVKQRKETAEIYASQDRADLTEIELSQAAVIESYLPKQMTVGELEAEVKGIIATSGAKSMADMGKVMGIATKQLAGKAEGKAISEMVRKLLAAS